MAEQTSRAVDKRHQEQQPAVGTERRWWQAVVVAGMRPVEAVTRAVGMEGAGGTVVEGSRRWADSWTSSLQPIRVSESIGSCLVMWGERPPAALLLLISAKVGVCFEWCLNQRSGGSLRVSVRVRRCSDTVRRADGS